MNFPLYIMTNVIQTESIHAMHAVSCPKGVNDTFLYQQYLSTTKRYLLTAQNTNNCFYHFCLGPVAFGQWSGPIAQLFIQCNKEYCKEEAHSLVKSHERNKFRLQIDSPHRKAIGCVHDSLLLLQQSW